MGNNNQRCLQYVLVRLQRLCGQQYAAGDSVRLATVRNSMSCESGIIGCCASGPQVLVHLRGELRQLVQQIIGVCVRIISMIECSDAADDRVVITGFHSIGDRLQGLESVFAG